jgi:hypothetical protein
VETGSVLAVAGIGDGRFLEPAVVALPAELSASLTETTAQLSALGIRAYYRRLCHGLAPRRVTPNHNLQLLREGETQSKREALPDAVPGEASLVGPQVWQDRPWTSRGSYLSDERGDGAR